MKKLNKILHIIPALGMGGAERVVVDICLGINRDEFESVVLSFVDGGYWKEILEKNQIRVIELQKKSKFDLKNFLMIKKIIKQEAPDIIHTHLGGDLYGRLAARLLGYKNIISTEHNVNPDEGFFMNFLKKVTSAWVAKIIAVSEAVARDAAKRYSISKEKIAVIYNGISMENFIPKESVSSSTEIQIGSAGRLTEQKGFVVLLNALAELKDFNFHCTIAGEGIKRAELEAHIRSLGLSERVSLPGVRADMPQFLHSLDIFVLPSLWEGLGIAVLEAGASSLPVAASNVDGIREIITDQKDGLLFEAGDAHALAKIVCQLINDPNLRQSLGKALRQKVGEHFSVTTMVGEYRKAYMELLK